MRGVSAPNYPLTLQVAGRKCVVVGAGPVGARRALGLVEAGALVTVIAPHASDDVVAAHADGRLTWVARDYLTGDLDGAWLVHATTGLEGVDGQVSADAHWSRIWCVQASNAELASAWVPAVARAGDIVVAVNAGRDPRRALNLRDGIAAAIAAGDLPTDRVRGVAAAPEATRAGSVALVGGGPGDDGLLTARAIELIAGADVVVVDWLAPQGILATLAEGVEILDVGKRAGDHPVPQDEINALLIDRALAGKRVVRLKGGDPYIFGRGGEELDVCRSAGIEVEVVSGVTSAISVPAAAGIPLTHRGLSRGFTVLTGHTDVGHVPPGTDHTIVLLMGLGRLELTCSELISRGHDPATPAAVLEDGFGPGARTTVGTLETIAARAEAVGARTPAITVIGDVVRRSPMWPPASV